MRRVRAGRRRLGGPRNERSRRSPVLRTLFATGILVLPSAIHADAAVAGTYVMRNCDVPGYPSSLLGPWRTAEMQSNAVMVDGCANGNGVAFNIVGARELSPGGWGTLGLLKPATGPQSQISFVKAVLWYGARLTGAGQPMTLWSLDLHSDGTFLPGVSNGAPGAENLVLEQQFSPAESNYYKIGVVCGPVRESAAPEPCLPADSTPFFVRGMEVTLSEDIQPIVLDPGGTLLAGGPQSGVRTLTYAASDPQSGLAKVDVLLDDIVVASHDLTPRCRYFDFTVCSPSVDDTLQVDTRAVPNGSHRVTIRVQDAAGNARIVNVGSPVDVANVAGSEASTVGAATATSQARYSLTARFDRSSRPTLTVPYGRRVSLRGQLAGGPRSNIAGAEIEVRETVDRHGSREATSARVRTMADGSFSYAISTSGPSRMLRLLYRRSGGDPVVSQMLRLRVQTASSLRASLRGVGMHFSGRVYGGWIPRKGKLVLMQGRAPGSAWKSFARLRTNRKGQFSGSFRLRVRRPGVQLRVRAVVPKEEGYPYVSGRSRMVTLRVR